MSEATQSRSMVRVVAASSAGTAFEWYDFFIFGSLTPVIAKNFLAGLDPTSALIAALALFAVGFAFRPLGAIIFGAMGDRVGRKATFLATVSLMGGATFAIGLLPTYAQAGLLAPILLVFLRICQGTALGGEYGGAAIYVAEHAASNKRGSATAWVQSSASLGLLAALLVIFATRTALGEVAFDAWGWRIPFLASAILLGISVWMRLKLSESPQFAKLRDEGAVTKTPLREAFATRDNLRRVLIAFFAVMCAQGAVWYFTFFYIQVFLEKSLGLPGATKDMLLIGMTLLSAPLYVFFGHLSDRIGRKPVMIGGMLLALLLYIPGSHLIANAVNPALVSAQERTPVVVSADPATCTSQFDPTGTRRFESACDIAKGLLVARGIGYTSKPLDMTTVDPSGHTVAGIMVGDQPLGVMGGEGLDGAKLKALKADYAEQLKVRLAAAHYPTAADPRAIDYWTLWAVLLGLVVSACALYGPQAAALVEMFPTRIRYTAMSLPYHVGTGWVGGFLPVTSFALVAITGNIYAGIWYPIIFTAISLVTALFFMKETSGKPLD